MIFLSIYICIHISYMYNNTNGNDNNGCNDNTDGTDNDNNYGKADHAIYVHAYCRVGQRPGRTRNHMHVCRPTLPKSASFDVVVGLLHRDRDIGRKVKRSHGGPLPWALCGRPITIGAMSTKMSVCRTTPDRAHS